MIPNKGTPTTVENTSVAALVEAISFNDEKALKNLYLENYGRAETFILQNSGSRDEARDIYQEAFIAVWRNIVQNRFHPKNDNSLNSYLLQVVRNKWLDHLRSARQRLTVGLNTDHPEEEDSEFAPDEQDRIDLVKKQFSHLGEMCRELLKRFYYDHESLRTISAAFDWTEATARNNKYRCIQKLRSLIQAKQQTP